MKKLFILLLLLSTPSFADEWTTTDSYRESAYIILLTTDWAQTRDFLRKEQSEANPILGKHPSQDKVDIAVILTGITHVYIASILPEKYRVPFQYISIGIEGGSVYHNFSFGVKVKF
jgi:hypothetical protein